MRVLIVKTSSLGDILHTLPAITDAGKAIPDIQFDWVVEEAFAEVPKWHPLVDRVIPIALRRWRKKPIRSFFGKEWRLFRQELRASDYDKVLDAQGLIKSALVTRMSRGKRIGFNKKAAREPLACFAYQEYVDIDPTAHAVMRMRTFFAKALGYELPKSAPDYGLKDKNFNLDEWHDGKYLLFLHGTTWESKRWPLQHWIQLAKLAEQAGYKIRLPWGNEREKNRMMEVEKACSAVSVLPQMSLYELASVIRGAQAVVAVDSGLGHLCAALNVPTISMYGPTDPKYIGTIGENQYHAVPLYRCHGCRKEYCYDNKHKKIRESSRCLIALTPEEIWKMLLQHHLV